MKKPKISVIVPVYNVEKYLAECLDSILDQTMKDYEIICVNDGSKDSSAIILNKYATRYPKRIKVIEQKNQGLSGARNTGIKAAEGEFLYFIDSDDRIHPQTLEMTYNAAKKYDAKLVTFNLVWAKPGETGKESKPKKYNLNRVKSVVTNDPIRYFNVEESPTCIWNSACLKLIHRDLFKDLKFERGLYYEDMLFTSLLLRDNPKTVIIPEKLYFYRCNEESIMHEDVSRKSLVSYHKVFTMIQEAYKDKKYQKQWSYIKRKCFPNALRNACAQMEGSSLKVRARHMNRWRSMLADLIQSECIHWLRPGQRRCVGYSKKLLNDLHRTSRREFARSRSE